MNAHNVLLKVKVKQPYFTSITRDSSLTDKLEVEGALEQPGLVYINHLIPSLHNSFVTNEDTSLLCKQQSNHSMLGVHASAWAIIHYGYIARKQNLTGVCLDWLSRFVWALCDRLYDHL